MNGVALFVVLVVLVTVAGVIGSAAVGRRIARLKNVSPTGATGVVLAALVFAAAVVALALGGPGSDSSCDGSTRDNVAAVIAIGVIPSIVIVVGLVLVTAVIGPRLWQLWASALALCVAAAVVDWFALTQSIHFCLE